MNSAKTNNIHSILPTGDEIIVGSSAGLWVLAGNHLDVYGLQTQSQLPGELASLATLEKNGEIIRSRRCCSWTFCQSGIN